jgi:peptidoglycan lytic transglycosylase D
MIEINVLLVVAFVLGRAVRSWSPRRRLRFAQVSFLLAFALPVVVRLAPRPALPFPDAQVWTVSTARSLAVDEAAAARGEIPSGGASWPDLGDRLLTLVVVAALAGTALRLSWIGWQLLRLQRSLGRLPKIRRLGRVAVVASPDVAVPFSAWLLGRAYVVIPERMLLDGAAYSIAVRHELAHHRQRDTLWIQAFEVLRSLTWWNPILFAWARRFSELMELACDQALVEARRVDPRAYARCLLATATSATRLVPATTGMAAATGSFLRRRIEMLLSPQSSRRPALLAPIVALLLLAVCAVAVAGGPHPRRIGLDEGKVLAVRAGAPGFPVVMDERVLERLNRLVGTPEGREFLDGALARMPEHRASIERRLAKANLPPQLLAVALVESGFRNNEGVPTEPTLAPGMRGAGVWMFIPQTAVRYGLVVDPARGIDERLDVAKETDAAIAYFGDLYRQFGDWNLALAAYNQGERHVAQAIERGGARDALALAEQGQLNDYVATVLAGVVVLGNPEIVE